MFHTFNFFQYCYLYASESLILILFSHQITMLLILLIGLHVGLMFLTKWCKGHMKGCLATVFYDWYWYHFLARWSVVIILIGVPLAIFRRLPRNKGLVPWRVWRACYLALATHIFVYGYGYSFGLVVQHAKFPIWIAKDTRSVTPWMHFFLSAYLFFFGLLSMTIRLFSVLRRYFFTNRWVITNAYWCSERTYCVEAQYMPHTPIFTTHRANYAPLSATDTHNTVHADSEDTPLLTQRHTVEPENYDCLSYLGDY